MSRENFLHEANLLADQQKMKTESNAELQQLQQQFEQLQDNVQSLKQQHQKENTESHAKIKDLLNQRKLVGDLVSELFQLPEDLVEQIVGDIEDEHDIVEGVLMRELSDGNLHVDARLPIEELEELLGIDFITDDQDDDVDTLGGLVLSLIHI